MKYRHGLIQPFLNPLQIHNIKINFLTSSPRVIPSALIQKLQGVTISHVGGALAVDFRE